ncbi:hypothetical protein [Draconibacterium sp.]|uniref:hypothetical protein n=1 Tax=Draconibacterium sp. TaxID=1965318 RepID=UPI003565E7C1
MKKATSQQKLTSNRRLVAREAKQKFDPAIKGLTESIRHTNEVTDIFHGYKVNAGTYVDGRGRTWQLQVHGVLAKGNFIKKDQVIPVFSKWAIGIRVKAFIKHLIDKTFS